MEEMLLTETVEFEAHLEQYRKERMEQKRRMLKTDQTELNRLLCEALDNLIIQQLDKQHNGEQEGVSNVYLCRLASSRYTESYRVLLGMSSSQLFQDDNRTETLWYAEPVYKDMGNDMKQVKKRLKAKELLLWKQKLLEDNWELLKEQFQVLMEENFRRITNSHLLVRDDFSALCGDYMERLLVVWKPLENQ